MAPFIRLIVCCAGSAAIARSIAARDTGAVGPDTGDGTQGGVEAVDAAQAAAGASGKAAPPLLQAGHPLRRDLEPDLDAAARPVSTSMS